MHRSVLYAIWVFIVYVLVAVSALAQENVETYHANVSVGGGFTVPTAEASSNFNTGWNLDFRGGLNVTRNFLADLVLLTTSGD
jgi:hypothetical protein